MSIKSKISLALLQMEIYYEALAYCITAARVAHDLYPVVGAVPCIASKLCDHRSGTNADGSIIYWSPNIW